MSLLLATLGSGAARSIIGSVALTLSVTGQMVEGRVFAGAATVALAPAATMLEGRVRAGAVTLTLTPAATMLEGRVRAGAVTLTLTPAAGMVYTRPGAQAQPGSGGRAVRQRFPRTAQYLGQLPAPDLLAGLFVVANPHRVALVAFLPLPAIQLRGPVSTTAPVRLGVRIPTVSLLSSLPEPTLLHGEARSVAPMRFEELMRLIALDLLDV